MARLLPICALIAGSIGFGFAVAESPTPTPAPSPVSSPEARPSCPPRPPGWGFGRDGGDEGPFKRFRDKLDQMGPKEREQFRNNWMRWKQMGDDERKDWQQRAEKERDRVRKIIDDTIAKTGLTLTADQREVFVVRYRQERRKIEEQLRQEMDAKRQEKIDEMLARLKAEFSGGGVKAATPSPTP